MSASRDKGTRAETAVVQWLRVNGHPDADRAPLRGAADTGDITGVPSHVISVKMRGRDQPLAWSVWLTALQKMQRNQSVRIADGITEMPCGLLVVKRTGYPDVGDWYAMTTVRDYFDLFAELLT